MNTDSQRDQSRLFVPMSEDIPAYRIKAIARIIYGNAFELTIVGLIVANAVALAALTFNTLPAGLRLAFEMFDSIVIWIFLAEIIIRILSYGKKPWMFFTSGWNVFDFLVIALIPFFSGATIVLRLLRLLRVVRLFRFMPEFKMLSNSLARSIKPLLSLVVLIGFFMFLFAMAGVYLFGAEHPGAWGDLGVAMITLTVLLTLENFPDSLEAGMEVTPFAWIYFVAFMFLVVFTVLNVLIGIVLNAMDEARADLENSGDSVEALIVGIEAANASGKLSKKLKNRLSKLL